MSKNNKNPLRFGFHRPVIDDKSFSFRLNWVNIYLLLCCVILIIGISAWLLVSYTSFTTWIGVGHQAQDSQIEAIRLRLDEMRDRLDAQNIYISLLKSRIQGEESPMTLEELQDSLLEMETKKQVDRIALDDTLRRRVRMSNINLPVRTPFILNLADPSDLEDEYLIPPINGIVRKSLSKMDGHYGVDIIAPANSAVKCVLDGYVIESDWTLEGGNTIIIQHDYNLISAYKHNSALLKKKGDEVLAGEAIAIIGNTGLHTDGPHVHFELWLNGEALDPEAYMDLEH